MNSWMKYIWVIFNSNFYIIAQFLFYLYTRGVHDCCAFQFCHDHAGDTATLQFRVSWQPCNGTDKLPAAISQLPCGTKSLHCFTCGINLELPDGKGFLWVVRNPQSLKKSHCNQTNIHYSLIMSTFLCRTQNATNLSRILSLNQGECQ